MKTDTCDMAAGPDGRIFLDSDPENLSGGVFTVDANLTIRSVTGNINNLYGFPRDAVKVGGQLTDFFRLRAERGDYGSGDINDLIVERVGQWKTERTVAYRFRTPEGRTLEIYRAPIDGGRRICVVSDRTRQCEAETALRVNEERLKEQVTELRDQRDRLEAQARDMVYLAEEVAQARDELSGLNAAKDKFFSIVAHDLKSPFAGLMGLSKILKDQVASLGADEIEEFADLIHRGADETYKLIEDLLDWSRLQLGRMDFEPVDFDIVNLINANVARFEAVAMTKDLDIEADTGASVHVHADARMTDTVLRNLISNAIKFSNKGGAIGIAVQVHAERVDIAVTDSGVGIAADRIASLFAVGERTSTNGTDGEMGTGLGLPLCQELLEKQNGSIRIDSALGKGSTFTVSLPAAMADDQSFKAA